MNVKELNRLVDEFEEFFLSDLPSLVFPIDRTLGKTMFRQDYFRVPDDIENYIKEHFKIFRLQIKKLKQEGVKI